jgi:hypothetical protein
VIRLVVANGCSCTRGAELPDPERTAWPVVLGERLGIEVVNLAMDGGSNRRIVRSTTLCIDAVRQRRDLQAAEVLVLLAWTQVSRHEYFSPTERQEERDGPPDNEVDANWQRVGPWRRDRRHRPSQVFYKHLWSEEGQLVNFLLDWVLLDRWLRFSGYGARYAFAFPMPRELPGPARQLIGQLESTSVSGGLPPAEGTSFLEAPAELPRGPGGHPLTEGHAWFSKVLAGWLHRSVAT